MESFENKPTTEILTENINENIGVVDESEENPEENEFEAKVVEPTVEKSLEKAIELKTQGNTHFKEMNYFAAVDLYRQALEYCPLEETKQMAILYSNLANVQFKMQNYVECVSSATKAIQNDENYFKPYFWRAEANYKMEKLEESLEDYQKAEKLDSSNLEVRKKVKEVTAQVEMDREKKKTELLSNLKQLGEGLLGKFGLSLDNFKLQQNENGSYNIAFQK